MPKKPPRGLSLLESLIGMSLSFFVILACLEFFGFTRTHFFLLKEKQETFLAASAALDKIRGDTVQAGLGLTAAMALGLITGVQEDEDVLTLCSSERSIMPEDDLLAEQTQIRVASAQGFKKGREIFIHDHRRGEQHVVAAADRSRIFLVSPLTHHYSRKITRVILLRKVSLFHDTENRILRRKVNTSSAQPLCDDVAAFGFAFSRTGNMLELSIRLGSEEKSYETKIFPKNTALAGIKG